MYGTYHIILLLYSYVRVKQSDSSFDSNHIFQTTYNIILFTVSYPLSIHCKYTHILCVMGIERPFKYWYECNGLCNVDKQFFFRV